MKPVNPVPKSPKDPVDVNVSVPSCHSWDSATPTRTWHFGQPMRPHTMHSESSFCEWRAWQFGHTDIASSDGRMELAWRERFDGVPARAGGDAEWQVSRFRLGGQPRESSKLTLETVLPSATIVRAVLASWT